VSHTTEPLLTTSVYNSGALPRARALIELDNMQATRRTQGGHWHGQQQAYAPQSYAPQPAGSLDFQQQRPSDETYRDHRRPQFHPDYLPRVWFGQDVATWIAKMEHIVLQFGEEIVCPEIFAHSFISGDAIKLWYMDLSVPHRKGMTTAPGCWQRFKEEMEHRFSFDVGLRQWDYSPPRTYGSQANAPQYSGLHDYGKARTLLTQFQPPQPAASYRQPSGASEQPTGPPNQRLHNSPMPPASSYVVPPASSYVVPPASSRAVPPASSYVVPPASSRAVPPASSYAMPPASSKAVPPASPKAMPPASSYYMPPASSYYMPPASSKAMPPASSYYMPPASSYYMPPAS
jgi:hypothetical protein